MKKPEMRLVHQGICPETEKLEIEIKNQKQYYSYFYW